MNAIITSVLRYIIDNPEMTIFLRTGGDVGGVVGETFSSMREIIVRSVIAAFLQNIENSIGIIAQSIQVDDIIRMCATNAALPPHICMLLTSVGLPIDTPQTPVVNVPPRNAGGRGRGSPARGRGRPRAVVEMRNVRRRVDEGGPSGARQVQNREARQLEEHLAAVFEGVPDVNQFFAVNGNHADVVEPIIAAIADGTSPAASPSASPLPSDDDA